MGLEAYFDDSEKDGYYAVGGFIAPMQVWRGWSDKWLAILKQKPRLGYFRSSDALGLVSQFQHFSEPQRDERLIQLGETFPKENFYGVSTFLKVSDYHEFFPVIFKPLYRLPFYICALYVTQHLKFDLRLKSKPVPKNVDYIFDRQGNVGQNFTWMNQWVTSLERELFPFDGDIRFEDKTKFLPLQAADMYVSWIRRNASGSTRSLASDTALADMHHISYPIEREWLARIAELAKEKSDEILKWATEFEKRSLRTEDG